MLQTRKTYIKGLRAAAKNLKVTKAAQTILIRIGLECWDAWSDAVRTLEKENRRLKKHLYYANPFSEVDRKK